MELGDFGAEGGVTQRETILLCYITATSLWGMIGATEERIRQMYLGCTPTTSTARAQPDQLPQCLW